MCLNYCIKNAYARNEGAVDIFTFCCIYLYFAHFFSSFSRTCSAFLFSMPMKVRHFCDLISDLSTSCSIAQQLRTVKNGLDGHG